jgi:subtilisin family serine protease
MRHLILAAGLIGALAGAAQALEPPKDPMFTAKGDIGQGFEDMWGFHAVGLTAGPDSAWRLLPATLAPVTVAVIDTGLDWDHLDISWNNIWQNPRPGATDAKDGYVDDRIGWDFMGRNNKPWDHDGHGTFVTGIIAATWNNGAGIAGINPAVKIMVLKALNDFGNSRASYLAEAIVYAADHGAKVIQMSVGGEGTTKIEQAAVHYAVSKGCLIVVAAGNEGIELKDYALTGMEGVITVGASDHSGQRAVFSNWGAAVDLVAPGLDILSLRARYTDTLRDIPGATYKAGAAYVGADKRYYVAGGTSFAAPFVSGIASLVWAKDPSLTAVQVKRILLNSAKDVGEPGIDQFTGHGLVDARAALSADKNFYIDSHITGVSVVTGASGAQVQVTGTADSDGFSEAHLEIGAGEKPASFTPVATPLAAPVKGGVLGDIGADQFRGSTVWIVRLVVTHKNGRKQEARFRLQLG